MEIKSGLRLKKRPDCEGCGAKESALMVVVGKMLCGDCVLKIQEAQKRSMLKILEENGN